MRIYKHVTGNNGKGKPANTKEYYDGQKNGYLKLKKDKMS